LQHPISKINPIKSGVSEAFFKKCGKQEVVSIISSMIDSEVTPRSFRLKSSRIETDHPFVIKAKNLGIECYGSPTMSDQAQMPYPSVKIGPGDSSRSHTANEFIYPGEIKNGIESYIGLLEGFIL
jgi:acetylornithine deacetylase